MMLRVTLTSLCLILSSAQALACDGRCITPKKFEEMTCAEQRQFLEQRRTYRDLKEKCAPLITSIKTFADCNEAADPKIQQSRCQRIGIANGAKNINAYCFDKVVNGLQTNGKLKAAFVDACMQLKSGGCNRLELAVSEFCDLAIAELGKPATTPQIAACDPTKLTRSLAPAADAPCNPPMTEAELDQGARSATGEGSRR